jgi:hypothetical protein
MPASVLLENKCRKGNEAALLLQDGSFSVSGGLFDAIAINDQHACFFIVTLVLLGS